MSVFPDKSELYPLKFEPIYRQGVAGGGLLAGLLHRVLPAGMDNAGESLELSDRDGAVSVVKNGLLQGCTLRQVISFYRSSLVGPRISPDAPFPVRVRLLDAAGRLPLLVHPNESFCSVAGSGCEPKTEMWYIMAARKGALVMAGLSQRATRLRLRDTLNSNEVESLLQVYPSLPGDAYFIPAGVLHSASGGNLILEIGQNSDSVYTASCWGEANGRPDEEGFKAIDFMNRTSPRIAGAADSAGYNRKFSLVTMCRTFRVDDLRLASVWHDDSAADGSCHILSVVSGTVKIRPVKSPDAPEVVLENGETAMVPFIYGEYELIPQNAEGAVVIKTVP